MKFKVGDRVKYNMLPLGVDGVGKVDEVCNGTPPMSYYISADNGTYWWCREDELELIQEKEQLVATKFKVGDRVKCYDGLVGVIEHIRETYIYTYIVKRKDDGEWRAYTVDELELIPPMEAQEPVPGKFYRTRDGSKFKFLMKASRAYLYEHEDDGEFNIYEFEGVYNHILAYKTDNDIIGEWTEEVVLPAMEIKQWVVVQREDKRIEYGYSGGHTDEGFKDIKRGHILKCSSDREYLKRHLEADEEIVELTGMLHWHVASKEGW